MSRRRRLLTAGALVGVVAATIAVVRRRAAVQLEPVAEDLRTPLLLATPSFRTGRLLPLLQSAPVPNIAGRDGVGIRSEMVDGYDRDDGSDVRVVLYEPSDRPRPSAALVWIHGGGYIIGAPEQNTPNCSLWADELGILVVSVDYRLAPDHPFPAPLDDCYAALRWVHEHADELGVDPDRIAVGGDSAGGGLAAALAQVARDRPGPKVCFQLLEEPMLDDRTVLREDHAGRGRFVWTPTSNRFGWTAYLGRPPVADDAPRYAAPARTPDLEGLPPAWIGVGELDLFHDEDVSYADALRAAGVPCELVIVPGMFHGAESIFAAGPTASKLRDAMTAALATGLDITPTTV